MYLTCLPYSHRSYIRDSESDYSLQVKVVYIFFLSVSRSIGFCMDCMGKCRILILKKITTSKVNDNTSKNCLDFFLLCIIYRIVPIILHGIGCIILSVEKLNKFCFDFSLMLNKSTSRKKIVKLNLYIQLIHFYTNLTVTF